MDQTLEISKTKKIDSFAIDALHIYVLFGFALAQPLFDLLSRNATFFGAHKSEPVDVTLLVLILCVVLPLPILIIEWMAGLFGPMARRGVHGFAIACLTAAIILQALRSVRRLPGVVLIVMAAILGMMLTLAYNRFSTIRTYVTVLSPAPLIFPFIFLFHSPVSKIVFPKDHSAQTVSRTKPAIPVVVVIFDQLPLTSLMGEDHRIDPIHYPNLSALAQDAIWFRNATTVSDRTGWAVPSILTGNYPNPSRLPIASDHPHNLFTFLSMASYRIKSFEPITQLCPRRLCQKPLQNLGKRIYLLLSDLSIVYLHILLPQDLNSSLPPINQNWKYFAGGDNRNWSERWVEQFYADRRREPLEFIDALHPADEQPTLYFLHALLPHEPFIHLPSEKMYSRPNKHIAGLLEGENWTGDEIVVAQQYQRHLLQVGYVDRLLGKLLTRLKTVGLYERSLIVVTSDHGASFRVNDNFKAPTKTNFQDILPVPLLIKLPYRSEGVVSDRNVETIDILPTIADILRLDLPWPVDGSSALNISSPERKRKTVFFHGARAQMSFDPSLLKARNAAVMRKLSMFGSAEEAALLFRIGPHSELVGRDVLDVAVLGEADVKIRLDNPAIYAAVDLKGDFVPAHMTGYIQPERGSKDPLELAIAINGKIRATTRSYVSSVPRRKEVWSAVVDETSFRANHNNVEIYVIASLGGRPTLKRAYKID